MESAQKKDNKLNKYHDNEEWEKLEKVHRWSARATKRLESIVHRKIQRIHNDWINNEVENCHSTKVPLCSREGR